MKPARWKIFLGVVTAAAQVYGDTAQTVQSPLFNMAGARSAAMGLAFTAVDADIDSISINPAGTAAIKNPWIATSYRRGVVDDNWGYVHYAHPVPFGALYAGGAYFDAGAIDLNFSNGTSETRHAQRDFAALAGLSLGKKWLSVGATAKFIQMELAEEAQATGYTVDAGALARTPIEGLNFGLSGQNFGPDVKFEQESESLPQRVRYGASYALNLGQEHGGYTVLLAVDGVNEKDAGDFLHAGFDVVHDLTFFEKEGSVSLRGGYQSDVGTFSAGLGLGIHNFSLDYAVRFHSDLDESHFATLGYRFQPSDPEGDPERPSLNAPRRIQ